MRAAARGVNLADEPSKRSFTISIGAARADESVSKDFGCAGGTTSPMRWQPRPRRSRLASRRKISSALASFRGLPHRIEFVRERGGVTYIDDSKGTNVGAVVEALAASRRRRYPDRGRFDKGGDYAPLRRPLGEKVKLAILIGAARDKMAAALDGATQIETVATLKEAVEHAARVARPGDTVLLSPACSSFDQFKDYAERGNVFKELVRAL